MAKLLEFYFDYGSPNAYLAHTQIPGIAERTGAEIAYRPMLLGGVFKATGNQSPAVSFANIRNKREHQGVDMQRFVRRFGVPFARNPHFPVNTLNLMRGAVAALEDGLFDGYTETIFNAMWVEPKKMDEAGIVAETLASAGLDPEWFARRTQDARIKESLIEATDEAVRRGVFGAPSFFVGDELYFGKDRLDFVEEALR